MIVIAGKVAALIFAGFIAAGVADLTSVPDAPCRYKVQWHEEWGGYYEWFCEGNCTKNGLTAPCYEWSGTIDDITYSWCDCVYALAAACDVWRVSNAVWECVNLECDEDCDKPPDDGGKHLACLCP